MFHADHNYTTILQRLCFDILNLCNHTQSGLIPNFTNVCDSLITCPLEAKRNYQITEKIPVLSEDPDVSWILNS